MDQIENKLYRIIKSLKIKEFYGKKGAVHFAMFLFFILLSNYTFSQKGNLELLPGSDLLGYDSKTGAHRLVGNVNFNYQGNTMYCDSAHYLDKTQEVRAYGRVQINKRDTLNLFCDSLYYNGRTKQAKLWGHVRVRDNEYKITTDSLDYDAGKGQAVYKNKGKIESINSNEVLTSKIGYFYPNSKNFFFKGNVVYKSPEIEMTTDTLQYAYFKHKVNFFGETEIKNNNVVMYCHSGWYDTKTEEGKLINEAKILQDDKIITGDTLYYKPKDSLSIGIGNVSILDTTRKLELKGHYAYNSEKENLNYITNDALAIKFMTNDTLFLHADTLFQIKDTSGASIIKAHKHVGFFSKNAQGRSDTLYFNDSLDQVNLSGTPIMWSKNSELSGRYMQVELNDSVIEKVHILDNALAVSLVDSGKYYNQIGGNEIFAYFKNSELSRTDVNGNAITLYYPEETTNTDTSRIVNRKGLNKLLASNIRLYLDSGEVVGVTYLDQPDGIFYPMDKIDKKDQFLSNFQWRYHLKPEEPLDILENREVTVPEEKETTD